VALSDKSLERIVCDNLVFDTKPRDRHARIRAKARTLPSLDQRRGALGTITTLGVGLIAVLASQIAALTAVVLVVWWWPLNFVHLPDLAK
jgi:hypothetical protein